MISTDSYPRLRSGAANVLELSRFNSRVTDNYEGKFYFCTCDRVCSNKVVVRKTLCKSGLEAQALNITWQQQAIEGFKGYILSLKVKLHDPAVTDLREKCLFVMSEKRTFCMLQSDRPRPVLEEF